MIDANISCPATRNFRGYPRYYPTRTFGALRSCRAVSHRYVAEGSPLTGTPAVSSASGRRCRRSSRRGQRGRRWKKRGESKGETTEEDSTAAKGRRDEASEQSTRRTVESTTIGSDRRMHTGNNLPPGLPPPPYGGGRPSGLLARASRVTRGTSRRCGKNGGPLDPFQTAEFSPTINAGQKRRERQRDIRRTCSSVAV